MTTAPKKPRADTECGRGHIHHWHKDGRRYVIRDPEWPDAPIEVRDVSLVRWCAVCGSLLRDCLA